MATKKSAKKAATKKQGKQAVKGAKGESAGKGTRAKSGSHQTKPTASSKKKTGTKRDDTGGGSRGTKPAGQMSGLDAAAKVLAEAGEPLSCREIVERALEAGHWSTAGKTPAATIYSAILREIRNRGADSRFQKVDRGRFARNA